MSWRKIFEFWSGKQFQNMNIKWGSLCKLKIKARKVMFSPTFHVFHWKGFPIMISGKSMSIFSTQLCKICLFKIRMYPMACIINLYISLLCTPHYIICWINFNSLLQIIFFLLLIKITPYLQLFICHWPLIKNSCESLFVCHVCVESVTS